MKCPKCRAGTKRTRVTHTQHCSDHTIRYCRCLDCGNKWKTEEKIVPYMKRPYYHPKGGGFNAKLNHSKVKEIRAIAKENEKEASKPQSPIIMDLAIKYGVEYECIKNVIKYKTWKNVD
jgi:transcriptional regulator NrdR family protein